MRAISLRPPLGNATAYWGRPIITRDDLPPPNMLGAEVAIHQGKRWDDTARMKASQYAAKLTAFRVPLEPKGYPQGVVAVATLGAFIDFTGEMTVADANDAGYPVLSLRLAWPEGGPAETLENDDGSSLPTPDGWTCKTGVLVTSKGMFDRRHYAVQFMIDAVNSALRWGDEIEGVLWCMRKITPFMNAVGCPGKHGTFGLDRNTMDAVRSRLRA